VEDSKIFYANTVQLLSSITEAVLIFKVGWPERLGPEQAREVCRIYVPKSLLDQMMQNWPSQVAEAEARVKGATVASGRPREGDQNVT